MKEIFKIAGFIFKEGIRQRVFIGLFFFFVFILAVCVFLGRISAGEDVKILRDAGLVGIEFSGLLIILFFISQNFYQNKYTKMLDLFMVRFKREMFLIGCFLGYILLLFFFLVLSFLIFGVICVFYKAFYPGLLLGVFFAFLKLSIVLSFCLLFSCSLESPLVIFLSTLFFYIASEIAYSALRIALASGSNFQKIMLSIQYRLLPNMDKLNIKNLVSYGQYPSREFVLTAFIYSAVYILFLFTLSLIVFRKKEYA